MTSELPPSEPTLSIDSARQIDRLCDAFEKTWIAESRPIIEDYLLGTSDDLRRELLRELIHIDVFYRRRIGENPAPQDYHGRFAEIETGWLETLIAAAGRSRRGGEQSSGAADGLTRGLTSPLAADGRIGTIRYFGDYELLEEIARGGMGVVFKARQVTLNRIVAVKMILSGQLAAPADVERFHAEAEAAANLDHPGIVPIFEVGEHQGQHYFSMGYVDGQSLSEQVAEGPLPPRQAAELVRTVCDAVQYAHEHKVIHRDLKPANILLDRDGRPRVTDFGLAKRVQHDSGLTATGQVLGTPSFMPPEQAAGKLDLVGPPADVYSLGGILYALLTGRPPFQSASSVDTLRQVLEKDPLAPRDLNSDVPRDLETITLKCLEKSVPQRYASARELADDLQRYLDGRPILARPVSRTERAWRWCHRNPLVASLVAAVATSLIAIAVVTTIAYTRAEEQRQAAEKLTGEKASALAKVEKQNTSIARGLIELGAAEMSRGDREKGMVVLAKSYEAAIEGDPVRESVRIMLSAGDVAVPMQFPCSWLPRVAFSPDGTSVLTTAQLWDTRTGTPIGEPMTRNEPVENMALSPNGATALITIGKTARLYDARTGQPRGRLMEHDDAMRRSDVPIGKSQGRLMNRDDEFNRLRIVNVITSINFSHDGAAVLTGSTDGTARLWDARTGEPIGAIMKHNDAVWAVAYSPDGTTLLTGDFGRTERLWDAHTCKPLGEPMKSDSIDIHVAWSPDGNTVATGGDGNSARLWDAHSGKPLGERMKHNRRVNALAFSPDGATVLSGSADGTARLWDARTGKAVGEPMIHSSIVSAAAYSPDGTTVLTGSQDRTARLWNARSGKPISEPMKHNEEVHVAAYSPDGGTVITVCAVPLDAGTARLWDARIGNTAEALMRHRARVADVAYSPDGTTIITQCRTWPTGTAYLWDTRTGKPIGRPMEHDSYISAMARSPDGTTVLTAGKRTARLWDARTGKPIGEPMIHSSQTMTNDSTIQAVAYSRDGTTVVTGSKDKTARLWDARTGRPLGTPMKHDREVTAVAFSPDGATVLTGSGELSGPGTAQLWDARTGKPIMEPMKHKGRVSVVAFSPDGSTVLTGSFDGTARLWNAHSGKPLGDSMKHVIWVCAATYSPDGATVLTGSYDKTARLWDARTSRPLGEPMKHDAVVEAVAYSPDGRTVLTGSRDKTARLWDARTGKPLGEPMIHNEEVAAVAYSPDGTSVLTGSDDGTARVWLVPPLIPKRLVPMVVAAHCGMKMNDLGQIQPLSRSELIEARQALETDGADWLAQKRKFDQRRRIGWHRFEAAEAEFRSDWFAAEFHLRWLLNSEPNDADLRKRHELAKQSFAAKRATQQPLAPDQPMPK